MARGKKTSPEDIYKIISSWAVTGSYAETSRELNIPEATVKKIVEDNKDKPEFVELCGEISKQFSAEAKKLIFKAMKRANDKLDNEEDDIPLNQLSTFIGTMYDKKALADGNSTEKITIDIKLPQGVDEYAG